MANCVDADHRLNELRGGNGRRYLKVPDEIEDFFFFYHRPRFFIYFDLRQKGEGQEPNACIHSNLI